jgi:lysozyme
MAYHPSPALLDLVKRYEGFVPTMYKCPAGLDTIGYGHVVRYGEVFEVPMSEADATDLLVTDLTKFAAGVAKLVTRTLEPTQFDALVSFAFNVGIGAFAASTLLKLVNAGRWHEAASEFGKWKYATVAGAKTVLPGLVTRRAAEADLFMKDVP